jgi:hypothetical protein
MFKVGPKPYGRFQQKTRKLYAIAEMAELFAFPMKQHDKNSHPK